MKELEEIPNTYVATLQEDVSVITKFLGDAAGMPILLIGSGGSFSAAAAAEYLLRRAGLFCKAVTPLELPQYKNQRSKFSAILFTAGGRNPDTLNTYQYLSELELHMILTICMNQNAPIAKKQQANLHSTYFCFPIPSGKDGYLAVNSTIASLVLLSKAVFAFTNDVFFHLPKEFPDYAGTDLDADRLCHLFRKDTIIVLHGGVTTPIAYDLESKFSEVALGNIQLVDFRNFAHGRHYWISTRGDQTAVLMLIGTEERMLAEKTQSILGNYVTIESLTLHNEGITGMLGIYADVFKLVAFAGSMLGVDPGRPKVANFGRKLYHLSCNPCTAPEHRKLKRSIVYAAVQRKTKVGHYWGFETYLVAAQTYLFELHQAEFKGVIFDYDGTLHEKSGDSWDSETKIFQIIDRLLCAGVRVGIATGRGKSVRKELQARIRREYWDTIAIGYYNGGCVASLEDNSKPDTTFPPQRELQLAQDAFERLRKTDDIQIELRPLQLTITSDKTQTLVAYMDLCRQYLDHLHSLKAVASSHSIDVIPTDTTKANIIHFFEQDQQVSADCYLFIGDSGQWGGNDYEMLRERYSLSVDLISQAVDSCWNFAPLGVRNVAATLFYLEHITIVKELGAFQIDLLKKRP